MLCSLKLCDSDCEGHSKACLPSVKFCGIQDRLGLGLVTVVAAACRPGVEDRDSDIGARKGMQRFLTCCAFHHSVVGFLFRDVHTQLIQQAAGPGPRPGGHTSAWCATLTVQQASGLEIFKQLLTLSPVASARATVIIKKDIVALLSRDRRSCPRSANRAL